jgi:DNA-directed RNA polymerase subunit RPC12/RpoP
MSSRTIFRCDECGTDLDELEPLSCPEHRARVSVREPLENGAFLAFDADLCGTCKRRLFGIIRNEFPKSWRGWDKIKEKDGKGGS